EQLEAALEVFERELEVALAPPHAAHLVERDGGFRLARRHPRQPQHALERAERSLEVADQLVDRAEVVPQMDARGAVLIADARDRTVEQPDRFLVLVLVARGLGGAPIAGRGLARFAGEREVAADLFLRCGRAALGVQLEPARDYAVVDAALGLVEALVD